MTFKTSSPPRRSSLDQKQHTIPEKRVTHTERSSRWKAQCNRRCSGYGRVEFIRRVPHAPRPRLPQVSVRLGTASLVSPQLSIAPTVIPRSSNCRFQLHLTRFLTSFALMRAWRWVQLLLVLCSAKRLPSADLGRGFV